jgi:hypothetical protein
MSPTRRGFRQIVLILIFSSFGPFATFLVGARDRASSVFWEAAMVARVLVLAFALLFGAGSWGIANAQDKVEDYVAALNATCTKEIKAQCKGVKEGRGRLLACLYAHENRLSARCGNTVMASLERLGVMLGALANVMRVCEADAKRICNGVVAGEGNLIGCLAAGRKSVSAQCNATLDAAFLRP